MKQTRPVHEIIAVEDGKPEGLDVKTVLSDCGDSRLRIINQDHTGATQARNRGVEVATGDIITFLDADDLWAPQKLTLQLSALEAGDGDVIFGGVQEFVCNTVDEALGPKLVTRYFDKAFSPISCLIKKADFERVGRFDPSLIRGEFIEWFGRAKNVGLKVYSVDEIVALRRLHLYNYKKSTAERQEYVHLAAKLIAINRKKKSTGNE
jgi:glycosyltransferase involved in cell wall biosynthesis